MGETPRYPLRPHHPCRSSRQIDRIELAASHRTRPDQERTVPTAFPDRWECGKLVGTSTARETRSRVEELEQTVADLTRALASRPVIDQAIGILMERHHCPAAAAFLILRARSQDGNAKLRDVAADLVREVGGADPVPPVFIPRAGRPLGGEDE
jgi:hypothetical protein